MRLKLIEAVLLIATALVVGGCDSCSPEEWLDEVFSNDHYIYCNDGQRYDSDQELPNAHYVFHTFNAGLAQAYPCPPSDNGSGGPLPNPSSMSAFPTGPTNISSPSATPHLSLPGAGRANSGSRTAGPDAASPSVYWRCGYRNGYIPPMAVLPNVPVPGSSPAFNPDASCPAPSDVLVVNHLSSAVTRISGCTRAVVATINVASRPLQVAVTPDASQALVTSFDNAINFINLSSNSVTTMPVAYAYNPSGLTITPDGTRAYVTSFNNGNPAVLVVDIASRSIVKTIPLATSWPHSAFATPDGSQVYVTHPFSDQVTIIDTLTNTVATSFNLAQPFGIAFNPTGTRAYIVSSGAPGTLRVFDTATLKQLASYPVGAIPNDVRLTANGKVAMVTNFGDASITAVDLVTGKVTTVNTGGQSIMGLTPVH